MRIFNRLICIFSVAFVFACTNSTGAQPQLNWKKVRVLVYTKNGKGYVHDNIASAVSCIQKMGKQHGFQVDTSADAGLMTEANLKKYTLLIFPSTNNDVFDTDVQRLAFRRYIEAGGGFVGIHSVTGTERNWKWFKMMMGGTFAYHPKFQKFRIKVIDSKHPSMKGVPKVWEKEDECYFEKELYPGSKVIMAHDLTSLNMGDFAQRNNIVKYTGTFGDLYPAVWSYDYDGGHTWCTVLGHDKKDYSDPTYINHLFQGISYVAGEVKAIDFSKAYAQTRDEAIRY